MFLCHFIQHCSQGLTSHMICTSFQYIQLSSCIQNDTFRGLDLRWETNKRLGVALHAHRCTSRYKTLYSSPALVSYLQAETENWKLQLWRTSSVRGYIEVRCELTLSNPNPVSLLIQLAWWLFIDVIINHGWNVDSGRLPGRDDWCVSGQIRTMLWFCHWCWNGIIEPIIWGCCVNLW